ncbi:general secretion pathway protein GspK [Methylomonas sp. MgM2]
MRIINRRLQCAQLKQRGLALVIVIWILTLLTLMAGSFAMTMRRDNSVSLAIKTGALTSAYAESGIILAQFMLSQSDPELRWQPNAVYRLVNWESEIRIRVVSESGKIDINTSNEVQLAALINWVIADEWQAQRLLNAVLDWRDADDDTRTLGAERRQYRQAGLPYGPTNSAFQCLEELQLVLGMNEQIFSAMQPFITVYSGQAEVDLRYASPQLLAIIGKELKERNIDDVALQNRADDTNTAETDDSIDSGANLGSQNQTYTILAEAAVPGEGSTGVEVIMRGQGFETDTPFQILDWKQNIQGPSLFDEAIGYPVITVQDEFRYDDRY